MSKREKRDDQTKREKKGEERERGCEKLNKKLFLFNVAMINALLQVTKTLYIVKKFC